MPRMPEGKSATRHRERLCIVMACGGAEEATRVGDEVSQVNSGCLVTYRKAEDVLLNAPAGRVALMILASEDDPDVIVRILRWMRRRWPHCPVVVIGDEGGGPLEMAARTGGASFLARPVSAEQWSALVSHVLSEPGRKITEVELG